MLLDRCKFSRQILDLREHRTTASYISSFIVQDQSSGPLSIQSRCNFRFVILLSTRIGLQLQYAPGFLGLIRLENPIVTAYNHNPNNGTTTGLILQTDEAEMKIIKEQILFYESFKGHGLLLRIILTEMSLKVSEEQTSKVVQNVMKIEHSTGQHTWDGYIAPDEQPKTDVELSREVHGLKIQTAVIYRRTEAVSIWIELLLEGLAQDQEDSSIKTSMLQWVRNLKIEVEMAKLDVELVTKRAENQVGAVSIAYLFWPPYSISSF